jgi:ABC-2 type transport system ATP-binding protein
MTTIDMAPVVEAELLVKIYPGNIRAVDGISFAVQPGEVFGLLGPNGAGKSTTIGVLTTTVKPTSGRAMLAGLDVARDPTRTRAISSVVFQDAVVDRPLTGRANLALHLRLWNVAPAAGAQRMAELADAVGITDLLDRPVATYSGGERRRLEIVRALLSAPQVLFLDEPTVGLDTRVRHDLFDAIKTIRERTGVTIILTTHYLDEAERLCDRLAIIDAGRIVACDTPAALLASVGEEILELRVADPDAATSALQDCGITARDIVATGSTLTASLRQSSSRQAVEHLARTAVEVASATTRRPTLDDVYLRLTGARIAGSDS